MGHIKVFMLAFTGVYISSTCANLVWVSISGSFQSVEFQNPPLSLNIQSSLVLRWGITSALGSCCLQPLSSFLQCKQDCVLCTGWIFLCTKNMDADRPSCMWCCVYRDHMAACGWTILPLPLLQPLASLHVLLFTILLETPGTREILN